MPSTCLVPSGKSRALKSEERSNLLKQSSVYTFDIHQVGDTGESAICFAIGGYRFTDFGTDAGDIAQSVNICTVDVDFFENRRRLSSNIT